MESDGNADSVRQQLHEIDRGESASWVVYPATPVWWPVSFGLWAATFALVVGLLDGAVQSFAQLGLVLLLVLAMVWDRRRRGTYPSGRPPRELSGPILHMVLGALAVVALAWLAGEQVGVWPAAGVAGCGALAVVARYEHEYAAASARVRERQA